MYTIAKGNEERKFELIKKHDIWALHFRRRLRETGAFDLIIHGRPDTSFNKHAADNDIYEKPLTLRVRIVVTE